MRKRRPWSNKRWVTHSLSCWGHEWEEYRFAADLAGVKTNGWIRSWLNEAVLFEKANAKERSDGGDV